MNTGQQTEQSSPAYVLITAAYNEAAYIERVLESVIAQTVRPRKWIIVSDGSTDGTDEIVRGYADRHSFITLVVLSDKHTRRFAAQVNAIHAGCPLLKTVDYQYIGNLDADISFASDYFERLMAQMESDSTLGMAGGFIYEERHGGFQPRRTNNIRSVPFAVQLFKRSCFEAVGGYVPLPFGGSDWHAEVCARMKGWQVASIPELPVLHHRPTGSAQGLLSYRFKQGRMDSAMGSDPLFELFKCSKRLAEKPYIVGAFARLVGFSWSACLREEKPVSSDFIRFLRREQTTRLRQLFRRAGELAES